MPQFNTPYPLQTQMNADSTFIPYDYVAITPSDTVDFAMCRGIWVGAGGTIVAVTATGNARTIVGALTGTIVPGYFTRVNSTSTTASSLMAIY